MLPSSSSFSSSSSSASPLSSSPVGKLLWEVGKALGKAVVAGIGLELARAASRQVKRVVGTKDGGDDHDDDRATSAPHRAGTATATATATEVERVRRENAALREELVALKRELGRPSADDDS
jgi:hypothetical protein